MLSASHSFSGSQNSLDTVNVASKYLNVASLLLSWAYLLRLLAVLMPLRLLAVHLDCRL